MVVLSFHLLLGDINATSEEDCIDVVCLTTNEASNATAACLYCTIILDCVLNYIFLQAVAHQRTQSYIPLLLLANSDLMTFPSD